MDDYKYEEKRKPNKIIFIECNELNQWNNS